MKKQTLKEQVSRIKGMMGKIMTESFEDKGLPEQPKEIDIDPAIKDEAMKLADMIKNGDESIVVHDSYLDTITLGVNEDGTVGLEYTYDVDVHEYPYFSRGRSFMSNGDVGYPDEGSDGDGEVYVTGLRILDDKGDLVWEGDDFTDMKFPDELSNSLLSGYFKRNPNSGY
jgi:hypothetical protein